jgi:hypothetical protein
MMYLNSLEAAWFRPLRSRRATRTLIFHREGLSPYLNDSGTRTPPGRLAPRPLSPLWPGASSFASLDHPRTLPKLDQLRAVGETSPLQIQHLAADNAAQTDGAGEQAHQRDADPG